jgi:hypothetical protein
MTTVGGRACWNAIRSRAVDVSPCVGADASIVTATGFGADTNYDASGAWTTVTGGALGRIPIASWLAFRARVEAFVPLSRPTFVVENTGEVHRPPTLGVATTIGAEILFF